MVGKADSVNPRFYCGTYHFHTVSVAVYGKMCVHMCVPEHREVSFLIKIFFIINQIDNVVKRKVKKITKLKKPLEFFTDIS